MVCLGCTLFLKQQNGQYNHLVKARDISTVLLWGAVLALSKKLLRFIGEKVMLMRKLQAKGKVLKISLNGPCMMVFKKFAGQLMYALEPLPQPLKEFDNLLASEKLCQLKFCVKFREQFGTISPQKYMYWSNTLGVDRFWAFFMLQFSLSLQGEIFCSKSVD